MQCVVHVSQPVQICGQPLKKAGLPFHSCETTSVAAPTHHKHPSYSGSFDQILEQERANAI